MESVAVLPLWLVYTIRTVSLELRPVTVVEVPAVIGSLPKLSGPLGERIVTEADQRLAERARPILKQMVQIHGSPPFEPGISTEEMDARITTIEDALMAEESHVHKVYIEPET